MKTFLKLACTAALAGFLAYGSHVTAADNFVVKDATGTTITKRSKDTGSGVQADLNGIINTSNTQIDPATEASVDGLEALIGTTNTNTASIVTNTGNISAKLPSALGTQAIAGSLSITPATSAVFPVSDNGGSLTVDGTVAATQSGTWNIGSITTLPSLVAGTANIGDVDVLTLPSLPAGTNNIGDVDVVSSALPTGASTSANQTTVIGHVDGLEALIGTTNTNTGTVATNSTTLAGTVKAEDAASADADPGIVINTKRLDTAAASSGTDGDYQPFITDGSGRLWTNVGALPAFIGSGSAATIQTGACATLEGCIRSMRDSLYAMETDTNPVAITNDGTNVLRVRDNASATPVRIVSAAASTNLTEIADSGGCRIISISGAVARTSPVYLKLYNAADGSVTVGTTTPYITIPLPAGGTNPTSFQFDVNQTFASAACSLAMTTAVADNSTAALTAADVVGLTVLWAVQ